MESGSIMLIIVGILAVWASWRFITFKIRREKR
jgi:hypothetical protein